jgi:hypothetical protein
MRCFYTGNSAELTLLRLYQRIDSKNEANKQKARKQNERTNKQLENTTLLTKQFLLL